MIFEEIIESFEEFGSCMHCYCQTDITQNDNNEKPKNIIQFKKIKKKLFNSKKIKESYHHERTTHWPTIPFSVGKHIIFPNLLSKHVSPRPLKDMDYRLCTAAEYQQTQKYLTRALFVRVVYLF